MSWYTLDTFNFIATFEFRQMITTFNDRFLSFVSTVYKYQLVLKQIQTKSVVGLSLVDPIHSPCVRP